MFFLYHYYLFVSPPWLVMVHHRPYLLRKNRVIDCSKKKKMQTGAKSTADVIRSLCTSKARYVLDIKGPLLCKRLFYLLAIIMCLLNVNGRFRDLFYQVYSSQCVCYKMKLVGSALCSATKRTATSLWPVTILKCLFCVLFCPLPSVFGGPA